MICPSCGSTDYKESRCCPLHDGQAVCVDCCKKCKNYDAIGLVACRHYINHPKKSYQDEIYKLNKKIETKKKTATALYRKNKPWIAEQVEAEIRALITEKRDLENERDNS